MASSGAGLGGTSGGGGTGGIGGASRQLITAGLVLHRSEVVAHSQDLLERKGDARRNGTQRRKGEGFGGFAQPGKAFQPLGAPQDYETLRAKLYKDLDRAQARAPREQQRTTGGGAKNQAPQKQQEHQDAPMKRSDTEYDGGGNSAADAGDGERGAGEGPRGGADTAADGTERGAQSSANTSQMLFGKDLPRCQARRHNADGFSALRRSIQNSDSRMKKIRHNGMSDLQPSELEAVLPPRQMYPPGSIGGPMSPLASECGKSARRPGGGGGGGAPLQLPLSARGAVTIRGGESPRRSEAAAGKLVPVSARGSPPSRALVASAALQQHAGGGRHLALLPPPPPLPPPVRALPSLAEVLARAGTTSSAAADGSAGGAGGSPSGGGAQASGGAGGAGSTGGGAGGAGGGGGGGGAGGIGGGTWAANRYREQIEKLLSYGLQAGAGGLGGLGDRPRAKDAPGGAARRGAEVDRWKRTEKILDQRINQLRAKIPEQSQKAEGGGSFRLGASGGALAETSDGAEGGGARLAAASGAEERPCSSSGTGVDDAGNAAGDRPADDAAGAAAGGAGGAAAPGAGGSAPSAGASPPSAAPPGRRPMA